jgi:hypothetical protein
MKKLHPFKRHGNYYVWKWWRDSEDQNLIHARWLRSGLLWWFYIDP